MNHDALANCFNRKKTIINDFVRHQNIRTKIFTTTNIFQPYIYKNINQNIKFEFIQNDVVQTKIVPKYDITPLYVKNIKLIYNIFQEKYLDNQNTTGLGDFIRGCYFLLQFCDTYNFKYQIIINHPIAFFLQKFSQYFNVNQYFYPVQMFMSNNWKDSLFDESNFIIDALTDNSKMKHFINYLNDQPLRNNNIFIYNIMFPYDEISEKHKLILRNLFEPNDEMILFINDTLNSIGFSKKSYSIIHVRSGDCYLNNNTKVFDTNYYNKLVNELTILFNDDFQQKYLLIADNNEIKLLLRDKFSSIQFLFKDITHLGEGKILYRENVKNTLLDFYLLSFSNSIHSFTCYPHGSGFSYWCAQTYDIPFKCKFLR
jgi:hypothetical protein